MGLESNMEVELFLKRAGKGWAKGGKDIQADKSCWSNGEKECLESTGGVKCSPGLGLNW